MSLNKWRHATNARDWNVGNVKVDLKFEAHQNVKIQQIFFQAYRKHLTDFDET